MKTTDPGAEQISSWFTTCLRYTYLTRCSKWQKWVTCEDKKLPNSCTYSLKCWISPCLHHTSQNTNMTNRAMVTISSHLMANLWLHSPQAWHHTVSGMPCDCSTRWFTSIQVQTGSKSGLIILCEEDTRLPITKETQWMGLLGHIITTSWQHNLPFLTRFKTCSQDPVP